MSVVGIGTVKLPVKRSLRASRKQAQAVLTLRNVLHIPEALCNIIGDLSHEGYHVLSVRSGCIRDQNGKTMALFDPRAQFQQVKLSGPPAGPRVGPSPFKPKGPYLINVQWSDSERERWMAWQTGATQPPLANRNSLSDDEKV